MRRLIAAVVLAAGLTACGGHGASRDAAAPPRAGKDTSSTAPGATASASLSATDVLVDSGVSQLKSGDAASARTTFRNVLELDPKNVYALYNLGLIAQQAHDDAAASKYYTAALASNGDYAPALFNEAIVLEKSDLAKSVALYQHAVAVDPTFAPAYVRLGFALAHQGKTKAAARARAQGLALDPTLASAAAPTY
jgi:tetratricopeptide (TPR) repeat protein